jgi:hypothetical protein
MSEIPTNDPVNHPAHYKSAAGIECFDVAKLLTFSLGNALKYVWRAGSKSEATYVEDLKKALWYLDHHSPAPCTIAGFSVQAVEVLGTVARASVRPELGGIALRIVHAHHEVDAFNEARTELGRLIKEAE